MRDKSEFQEQGVRTRANKKERRGASLEVDKKSVSSPNDGETTKQRNGKRKRNHAQNSEYVSYLSSYYCLLESEPYVSVYNFR